MERKKAKKNERKNEVKGEGEGKEDEVMIDDEGMEPRRERGRDKRSQGGKVGGGGVMSTQT